MAGRGRGGGHKGPSRPAGAGLTRVLLPTNESASLWNWTLSPGAAPPAPACIGAALANGS